MIRPEAKATMSRWRECLIAVALFALAVWFWRAGGLLSWLAPLTGIGALALGWVGLQRGRFRGSGEGAGVVQVVEGQVSYFGVEKGGAVALRELERLILDGRHWRLYQPGLPELVIPIDARGADSLFDAFSALPGLKTERMLAEMRGKPAQAVVIWERTPTRAAHERLH